ncbi:MAG TPA: ZirU family protein [Candidatus Babeliales bacterium]|nr:ZirU family protein [Candidatus Babeliales bacterium]
MSLNISRKTLLSPLLLALLANAALSGNALAASATTGTPEPVASARTAPEVRAGINTTTNHVLGRAPTMAAPTINHTDANSNGAVDTGDTLTLVNGAFTDQDSDPAGTHTYRWLRGATVMGTTTAAYTVVAGDLAQTMTGEVTPRTDPTATDPASGTPVTATRAVAASGFVTSVALSSNSPIVGTVLTATPTCVATCGAVAYQWQVETANASGSYTNIAGATNSTYTPIGANQRLRIRVNAN